MLDWFYMDGRGPYVWAVYAVFFVVVAYNLLSPLMARKQVVRENIRRQKREAAHASRS